MISVIIPTYNEEKDISECIKSLFEQSEKNFEILIVDDGSEDNTLKEVKKFGSKKIKVIMGQHRGPGFSRNLGAKLAKGKILVFVDADMTFHKDYLKNLTTPLKKDESILGTTHEEEYAVNMNNIWSRCWGKIRVSKESAKEIVIFRAINKERFLNLGGFDPKLGYADDQTFLIKHRLKPKVAKGTICYHKNPETLKEVYKQSKWIGASIENKLFRSKIILFSFIFLSVLISPLAIFTLSIKKCSKNKDWRIIFPNMIIFMCFRYFGTLKGIYNNYFKGSNLR